ncbi:MAG TPA: hypothetical protein VFP61_06660 [Acidimicrobiales bacterium]|nr:hypothetical protein [Acidimicrobiales bacterium]
MATTPGPDAHLRARRQLALGHWPLPEDDQGSEVPRGSVRVATDDGAPVRRLLCRPPGGRSWRTPVPGRTGARFR